ncbi:hypothetical protein LJR098_003984 [Rhizobium sp. LjRoot98]|uniref:hypothetical protein n=1 Tax=unclassified Rhizobium TaxID=2613769 RepID=UPI0007160482|nr:MULTISPECIES: hypothetical protein [unclassified Rhizobium]KQV39721.1 hypothetical protein ASC96_22705 [Rhizobium sp. Root1204]KQY01941.1 hypothetical protein ASD36_17605 [Rhizobium sp. Root1334]KRB97513.1 hypothetical protein ASE23_17600 [Rhizobium sp. Root73]
MTETCRILTPAEQKISGIMVRAEQAMMAAIYKAVEDATTQTANELRSIGAQDEAPAYDYFAATAQQQLFLSQCGADPETLEGGNPEIAAQIITNYQNISDHYWRKKG